MSKSSVLGNDGEIAEALEELQEAVEDAKLYVELGKKIIAICKPLGADVLRTLLQTFCDLREECAPELERNSVFSAKATHRDYQNYVSAGFTKQQAFALVLASIKPSSVGEAIGAGVKSGVASAK